MKNSYLILFILLTIPSCSIGQNYTVVHVTGRIYQSGTTRAIRTGDQLKAEELLEFPGQNAWSIVINEKGDQYFIQQPTPTDSLHNVKQSLQVVEKTVHPVTRATRQPVQSLRNYFAGSQFVFIGNDFYLELDPKQYPLNEKLFLLYRYEYNSRIITHKLPLNKQLMHLNKSFLYEYKGDSIPYQKTWNTELTYFNSNTNLPGFAAGFRPIWLDEKSLKEELMVLQKVYPRKKTFHTELKKIFLQYVLDVYGKTDEIIFMDWVEEQVLSQK